MMYSSDMTEDTRMSAIKGTYRPLKVLDHEFLGRVHVLQHYATSQLLIMKERTANNRDHFREEEALIEKRAALRHPNVMILKDWSMKTESKLCAEFYILRTFMQYYTDNVELIARKKAKENGVFDDIELVQLLYDGIDGLSYLQSQGYSHGFLRPELLLKDEKKSYVICDRLLEGTAMDAQRYARSSNFDLYCSPEVWNNLVNHKSHPTNGYLDDAFAFGLILLRVANLQSPKEIYLPSGLVDQNRLNSLIEKAASRYDHVILFRQVLEKLLNIDPKSRTDATAIKAGLPNRQQIQMFFDAETEDLYFDGPKSQMHNTMLGRESVLPVPQKNQSMMLGRSSAGDRSHYLAGLNNSSAYKPTGGARDPIFTSGNVLPSQVHGNTNFSNDGYNSRPQYGGQGGYTSGTPQHIQQVAPNQYPAVPLNNSQPYGQPYNAVPQNYQNQAAPQPLPRQIYQQPSTSLGQNQMIPSAYGGANPLLRSTANSNPPSQNLAFEQQGQNRIVAQPGQIAGYTGGNPFLAGPATNGVAPAGGNFNAGAGAQPSSGPASYQTYGQGAVGGRAGPANAQLQAQAAYGSSPSYDRPAVQSNPTPARPAAVQGSSGAGSRQSNYMQGDPNMIAPPKTGNKFAPL